MCDESDKLHKEEHCPKLACQQIQTKYPQARQILKHASSEHDITISYPDHKNSESFQTEIIRTQSLNIFCLDVDMFYCGCDVADSQSAEYSSSDAKNCQDIDNNAVTVTTPILVKTYILFLFYNHCLSGGSNLLISCPRLTQSDE